MVILKSAQYCAKKGDVLHPLLHRSVWSLILVRKGNAYCSTGLRERVITENNILIIPPTLDFCILPMDDYEHIYMEMSEQILPGKDQFFCLHDDELQTGSMILRTIARLLRQKSENYQVVAEPLSEALRQFLLVQVDQGPGTDLIELERLLRRNIANASFQIEDALKEIPQSPGYTRRLFREAYGCSPRAYLTNLRIGSAKILLMTQNLPITEIAEKCGFSDAKSFTHRFHQATGYAPRDYKLRPPNDIQGTETEISHV